jgi:hypothetical protein
MAQLKTIERGLNGKGLKSNFEKLQSIVRGLTPEAQKLAPHYIILGHNQKFKGVTIQLFELLLKEPKIDINDALVKLGNITKHALENRVLRLKEILGYLLVNENLTQKENYYSPRYQAFFLTKDYLKQYHVLITVGATQEAYDKLTWVIQKSKEYEWYDSLIEAFYLQIEYLSKMSDSVSIDEIDQQIVYYEFCRRNLRKARLIFDELSNVTQKSISNSDLIAIYDKNINHLEELYLKTSSNLILYQIIKLKVNASNLKKDYNLAEKNSQDLLNLVTNAPSVSQPDTKGIACIYISESLIYQKKYKDALIYTLNARSYFAQYSYNYGQTLELEYHIQLYNGDYTRAEVIIKELLDVSNYPSSPYHIQRKTYMLCCALFAQEKYDEAWEHLQDLGRLKKDKTGWKIGIRFLTILLLKLRNDYLGIENVTLQWRREMATFVKNQAIRKRDLRLFSILLRLCRSNESWSEFVKKNNNLFKEFEEDRDLIWLPATHELIDVLQWLKCKANRKPYQLTGNTQKTYLNVH